MGAFGCLWSVWTFIDIFFLFFVLGSRFSRVTLLPLRPYLRVPHVAPAFQELARQPISFVDCSLKGLWSNELRPFTKSFLNGILQGVYDGGFELPVTEG